MPNMSTKRWGKHGQERSLCACWSCLSPWKQWVLLIWPNPLSSVNSPRQHGSYHCCCNVGGRQLSCVTVSRRSNGPWKAFLKCSHVTQTCCSLCELVQTQCFLRQRPTLQHLTVSPPCHHSNSTHSTKPNPVFWLGFATSNWIQALSLCCIFLVNIWGHIISIRTLKSVNINKMKIHPTYSMLLMLTIWELKN